MTQITHLLDGQNYGVPRNWQDIEITVDWLNKKESGAVNVSDLAFVGRANRFLQNRILNGVNGGVGIFEGAPYKILLGNPSAPSFIFDGYLDFTEELTVFGREEIVCALKTKKGDDWLNDNADGVSFASMYDDGEITSADFVKVPYVINYVPDGMQLIVISLSIYVMTKEIIENVAEISEAVAQLIKASIPDVGSGVGVAASAPPAPVVTVDTTVNIGEFIYAILKVLARIAYTIAMIIAIVNLINELFEQILPKKRYHLGMRFETMFQKFCSHFGMQFQSTLISQSPVKNWVYIPRKDRKGGESGERGFPQTGSEIYTGGDFIRTMKELFNADYRIRNNVFYFERKDQFYTNPVYQLPGYFNEQDRRLQSFKFNTSEMLSNYNIVWAYDTQDQNTLDDQTGRVFQAITKPINTVNQDFVTIKNLGEVSIPFSLGKAKTGLTTVENLMKDLASIVDTLTGLFGGGTNFSSRIEARKGALLLSSHFTTTGKVVVMQGANLALDQRAELSARKIWEEYHYINSFAEYNGVHNQYKRILEQPVKMTLQEFALILQNNKCTDASGNEYEIEQVKYKPEKGTALIDYRFKYKYTNNLQIQIIE